jgi:S-disulfanyl-L-cysteine oxidoreductase SoxD
MYKCDQDLFEDPVPSPSQTNPPLRFIAALLLALWVAQTSFAQAPTYGVGRKPTAEEIKAWDISIGSDGKELPPGHGTASGGKEVYTKRCLECHGADGKSGKYDALVGGQDTLRSEKPVKTVGSYWPYATTLWDHIHRAMPFDRPGTLTTDQVYDLTAYLLFLNGIIGENEVMDALSLPNVKMPNRNGFVPDPRPDTAPPKQLKVPNPKPRASPHAQPKPAVTGSTAKE